MADSAQMIHKVAVIGAGAWGTTLARYLAEKGLAVCLWAYEREVAESIRRKRENTRFLPDVPLPESLAVTSSLPEAVDAANLLIFAVPSHAARSILSQLGPLLPAASEPSGIAIISATKGIEEGSLKLMSQVMAETLPLDLSRSLTILSGPSFASEVCRGLPTAVVLAGENHDLVRRLQALLISSRFRVYAGNDPIGVQLGGALKNVMALAAGIVDGLALGHNARAGLITRGLAEMVRLGTAMGAQASTFYGLSGVGDLVLTCTGPLSRNYTVGVRLGRGERLPDILKEVPGVAEGVRTSRAAQGLAERCGVEMPIVREVCAVLFQGKPPRQAVDNLMERTAKDEWIG